MRGSGRTRLDVKKDGTFKGARPAINLTEGSGVTLTVADDPPNDDVTVIVEASGTGGAHAIGGASHESDTIQNIRTKCSDATIETTTGSAAAASAAVDAHKDLATNVHGAGGSTLATTENIATHAGLTATVHGFDASGNAPAQTHDNTRHTAAFALASALSTHEGLTTTAHGGVLPGTAFSGLAKITVGTVAPGSPSAGDLWVDTN
jgi:hypothetical protein